MLGAAIVGKLRHRPETPYSSDGSDSRDSSPARVRSSRRGYDDRRGLVRKYRSDLSNQSIISQEPMAPLSSVYVAEIPGNRFTHDNRMGWSGNEAGSSRESIPVTERTASTISSGLPKAIDTASRVISHGNTSNSPVARVLKAAKGMAQVLDPEHNARQPSQRAVDTHEQGSRVSSHLSVHQDPAIIPEDVASDVSARESLRERNPSPPKPPSPQEPQHRNRSSGYRHPSVRNESSELATKRYDPQRDASESSTAQKPAVETIVETPPKSTRSRSEPGGSGEKLSPFPDLPESDAWNDDGDLPEAKAASPVGSAFESIWEPQIPLTSQFPNHARDKQSVEDGAS